MILVNPLCEMCWSFALIFFVCEFGHKISDKFDEFGYEISQLDWYLFSLEIQKMLPFFLIVADRPPDLNVFGDVSCGREDFKMVSLNSRNEGK